MEIKNGDKAPNFKLKDQYDNIHKLSDYKGGWLLIYFYPKDSTPGCTVEGQVITDHWKAFKKAKLAVLGVSADTVASHKKFSEKYKFPFPLLADTEKEMVKDYGAWKMKKFMGRESMGILRISFLIDSKGKIRKIYEKVKPKEHATEVLADIKELS